ncbi:UPF0496 protein At1g20180-like [Salvia splendens]|uniref:UPF0496 protein At1g20180-like n=1 Tax=Salvia splendens TaxID=180675 RepID=UPI0011021A49|nr:UPF0496 protein At1g20180-like [Salvia splendens]
MLSLRKILMKKLKSSFEKEGGNGKGNTSSLRVKTAINEEYKEAFRTKSYTEFCDKIQSQLESRTVLGDGATSLSSSSSSPPLRHLHLSEYLVEPRCETLVSISKHHRLLTDYFDTGLEAGRICESILQKIHQVRVDYHAIRSLIEPEPDNNTHTRLLKTLASFALHGDPFASMTPQKFKNLHENHQHFLHRLTSKRAKTKKRKKLTKFIKRALAIGCGALALALLLLVVHGAAGVVAAPVLVASSLVLFDRRGREEAKGKQNSGVVAQLDAAARGVYILINDFDMMSRLVQRLRDEMEHRKFAAGVCVRKGKKEALKEVVRDELGFLEQLEELEKQIYLCFLDINRSRKLLIQELEK